MIKGNTRIRKAPVFLLVISLLFGGFPLLLSKGTIQTILNDGLGYYIYLPAFIIYNDLYKLDFVSSMMWNYENTHEFYQATQLANGNFVFGYTSGLAMLQLPFFIAAHIFAKLFHLKADGFSTVYQYFAYVSGLFYGLFGLHNTVQILLTTNRKSIVFITIICLLLGTNLFYYMFVANGMGHVYSFFLISQCFVSFYFFLETKHWKHSFLLGLSAGLLFLIRPTNSIVFLPLLFSFMPFSFSALKERLLFFNQKKYMMALSALIAAFPTLVQMCYWKTATGQYFFNPYAHLGLGFDFGNAHFHYGWFSVQRGLFFYSPILLLSVFGLLCYRKRVAVALPLIFAYFMLNSWVICSWKTYDYGGSYGSRPMVESFVVLVLPLANAITFLSNRKWTKTILYITIALAIGLNMLQTYKYTTGRISGYSEAEVRFSYFSIDDLQIKPGKHYTPRKADKLWQINDTVILENGKTTSPMIEFRCDTISGRFPKALVITAGGEYDKLNLFNGKKTAKIVYVIDHNRDAYSWKEMCFLPQTPLGDTTENTIIDYRKLPKPLNKQDVVKIFVMNANENRFRFYGLKVALFDLEKED